MGILAVIVGTGIGIWLVRLIARAYFRRFGAVMWQAILLAVPTLIVAALSIGLIAMPFGTAKELGPFSRLGLMICLFTYTSTYRSFKKRTAADNSPGT